MKNDYNKNYFWIIKDLESLENKFYLKPKGQLVEVDEEVFKICYNSYKKIMRDNSKDNRLKMMSLDSQFVDGITYIDMIADNKNIDIEDQYKVTTVLDEIDKLKDDMKQVMLEPNNEDKMIVIGTKMKEYKNQKDSLSNEYRQFKYQNDIRNSGIKDLNYGIISEYDETLVRKLINKIVVKNKNEIEVQFKGGFVINQRINYAKKAEIDYKI